MVIKNDVFLSNGLEPQEIITKTAEMLVRSKATQNIGFNLIASGNQTDVSTHPNEKLNTFIDAYDSVIAQCNEHLKSIDALIAEVSDFNTRREEALALAENISRVTYISTLTDLHTPTMRRVTDSLSNRSSDLTELKIRLLEHRAQLRITRDDASIENMSDLPTV